jgi:hypothetical protein
MPLGIPCRSGFGTGLPHGSGSARSNGRQRWWRSSSTLPCWLIFSVPAMADRHGKLPPFPLTADLSGVLASTRHDRLEPSSRSFARFGALLGRLDQRRAAQALLRPFNPDAYRSDRGTVH